MADDNVQHGIDDNPEGDPTKGAVLGGVGGAVVGALAGGPLGAVIGAVAGAVASGAGVAAVDRVDNDNTVTGVGEGATTDVNALDDADTTAGLGTTTGLSATRDADDFGTATAGNVGVGSTTDDNIQHGIDDSPRGDATKGAVLGGLGGAAVGAAAGGPIGAVVGGVAGAVGSGAGVAATDRVDNDNTVTGVGQGATRDVNARDDYGTTTGGLGSSSSDLGTSRDADDFRAGTVGVGSGTTAYNAADDNIQHGIDDNPHGDATKGAVLGGLGGAAVGAAAGGPIGAVVGGVAGAVGSGAGVAATDRVDNDNTVTGVGQGATTDVNARGSSLDDALPGNDVPGVQTGGRAIDGTPDTRGITEKAADAVTGDRTDDKTGRTV